MNRAAPSLPAQATQVGLAVDVVAFAMHGGELQVLLVERGELPHARDWALPGGFVQPGEELHEAALRELRTETSVDLEPRHLEQFYTFGALGRDPRGRVVSVAHLAVLPHGTVQVTAGGHTVGAAWQRAHHPPGWPSTTARSSTGRWGGCNCGWNTPTWRWTFCPTPSRFPNSRRCTRRS